MDYNQVDHIMAAKGISDDAAFDNLYVSIEQIPCTKSPHLCPLGLYYPDEKCIVLPPEASAATLLHELGHRHGHYYSDNLSEKYAENFRKLHQRRQPRALLYTGDDFDRLPELSRVFEEGESGALEVALLEPASHDKLNEIRDYLQPYSAYYGEAAPRLVAGNSEVPWVRFEFTKGVDWMVITGAAVAAVLLMSVGIMAYSIYKTAKDEPWMVPFILLGTLTSTIVIAALNQEKVRQRVLKRV